MNLIPVFPKKYFSFLHWLGLIVLFSTINGSCNNNNDQQGKTLEEVQTKTEDTGQRVLMALEIKFKPKVTSEMRDRTIRAITKLFSDSVKMAAEETHQNIPLTFYSVVQSDDSSTVGLVAKTPGSPKPPPPPPNSISIFIQDTTKCNCTKGCGVCLMLVTFANTPTASADNSPYKFISEIRDMKPEKNF